MQFSKMQYSKMQYSKMQYIEIIDDSLKRQMTNVNNALYTYIHCLVYNYISI